MSIPLVRNQAVQEAAWRRDRISLTQCLERHEALTAYTGGLLDELDPP